MKQIKSTAFFIVLILIQQHGLEVYCHEQSKGDLDSWKETITKKENLVYAAKVAGTAAVGIAAAPAVLGAAGFTAAGVAAGTLAAAVQSAWFGGAITGVTGAAFSALQSVAAGGLTVGAKAAIVSASGAAVKIYDSVVGNDKADEKCDDKARMPEDLCASTTQTANQQEMQKLV